MHDIVLKKIQFKNLLSYGSNLTEVSLDKKGITWIRGSNGSGKSTIIEAIYIGLFGTPYRKIPAKEMINTANKGKMWVALEFDRVDTNGTSTYLIERELGKSGSMKLKIHKDGSGIEQDAGASQKLLEDDILGFNKNLFENVIAFNSIQSKPFIDMDSAEKRKLIESILSLNIDKIRKMNATEITLALSKFNDARNDSQKYIQNIIDINSMLDKLRQEQADDIKTLQNDIDVNLKSIETITNTINAHESELKVISENGTKLNEKLQSYSSLKNMKDNLAQLKLLEATMGGSDSLLSNAQSKYDALVDENKKLIDQYNQLVTSPDRPIPPVDNENKPIDVPIKLRELNNQIQQLTYTINSSINTMKSIKDENDLMKSGVPCPTCGKPSTDADIEPIREKLRGKWVEANTVKKNSETQLLEIQSQYDELSKINTSIVEYDAKINQINLQLTPITSAVNRELQSIEVIKKTQQENNNKRNALLEIVGDIPTYQIQITKMEDEITVLNGEISDLRVKYTAKATQLQSLKDTKRNTELVFNELKSRLDKRLASDSVSSITLAENQLKEAEEKLNKSNEEITKYSDEVELLKYIDQMYSDEGIKKFILKVFVPTLNQVIAHNISLFSLPVAIEFDDSLEFEYMGKFGMASVYKGLSQGQQRKLNFCISMGFRDFVSAIADFRINIMFLDEVLDISTDYEALRDMFGLIKQKNQEIESIYLMSHRGDDFIDEMDYILDVSHDGLYSTVRENS